MVSAFLQATTSWRETLNICHVLTEIRQPEFPWYVICHSTDYMVCYLPIMERNINVCHVLPEIRQPEFPGLLTRRGETPANEKIYRKRGNDGRETGRTAIVSLSRILRCLQATPPKEDSVGCCCYGFFSSPLLSSVLGLPHVHARNETGEGKTSIRQRRRRYTLSFTGSWARASHSSRSGNTSSIVRAFPARAWDSIPSLGADSTSVEFRNTNPQTLMWDIPGKKNTEYECYRVPLRVDDGTRFGRPSAGRWALVRRQSKRGSSRAHPSPQQRSQKPNGRLVLLSHPWLLFVVSRKNHLLTKRSRRGSICTALMSLDTDEPSSETSCSERRRQAS